MAGDIGIVVTRPETRSLRNRRDFGFVLFDLKLVPNKLRGDETADRVAYNPGSDALACYNDTDDLMIRLRCLKIWKNNVELLRW